MKITYKFLILSVCVVLLIFSCTNNFEEINTNPNEPDDITDPGLLLSAIIRKDADAVFHLSFSRGTVFADQLSDQYASCFTYLSRDDASGLFLWSYYDTLKDLLKYIDVSEKQGLSNYQGIGLVIKSWMFQCLTDIYGPIPYSEAGKAADGVNFPKYDSQETVYAGILADLELANNLMGTTSEIISGDILYNGDVAKWKMFANGLRLRVLLRQSARINPSSEMQKIISSPEKYPLFSSHNDQAALQYLETKENAHPAYRGNVSDYANSFRLSYTMEKQLKTISDPRIAAYAMPTPATANSANPQYYGVPNGISDADVNAWNGGSLNHSAPGLLWAPYSYSPGFASMTAAQTVILSYSEVQFILAEAKEKGYITIGDAGTYYLNGIKDQFEYYSSRIPSNYLVPKASQLIPDEGYYTQSQVAYTGTTQEKLVKIYTQKWISLFMCGCEAWSEWRRVGVPKIIPGPNSGGPIPLRVLYPADEMRINVDSYNEAVKLLGGDGDAITTSVWWDVN